MATQSVTAFAGVALGICLIPGCTSVRPGPLDMPTLMLEQGSLQMTVAVGADGTGELSGRSVLVGRISVSPILEAEGVDPEVVRILLHQGHYYVTADGFQNLWEVKPRPGTSEATYSPMNVAGRPLSNTRLSRYGQPGHACVRLDADGGGPWYVTHEGTLRQRCA